MKHCSTCILLSILLLSAASVSGQEVLLAENFNDCEFPGDWTVTLNGNTDAVWFVGTTENENADGSSIDGSCMLIFDDDATGENTPAWDVELLSPTFDATGWATVQLSMDVHFRNYNGSAQLEIIVFDGTDFQRVSVYQGGAAQTGEQFSAFTTLTADLSFFANETMRIGIRYNDGNDWAWWAGIDNIQVVGSGTATPILLESFNDCGLPEGWVSEVVGGNAAWEFGLIEDNDETQGVTSMNGSCFAFFDDDGLGQEADPSRALLLTPVLDGLAYANYYLQMDVILRRFTDLENLSIGVFNVATGEIAWVVSYLNDIAGPLFNQYQTEVIDLSAYRQAQMRVVLSYDDGNDWGWWVGIDNLKILGEGVANDICTNAVAINLDASCLPANNRNTLYTGNDVACSTENEGALWYRYTATTTQLVQLQTNARYNDAISVFSGSDCTQLQEVDCTNYDEFGFTGEDLFWQTEANTTYFIRVAGHKGSFGVTRGEHCIQLLSASTLPERPTNDWCVDAQALNIGATCVVGNNRHADFDGPQSSRTDKSKADIWYTFETTTTTPLEIITNADFADVITVFTGNCENLEEVATQELGQRLLQEEISAGQTYFIQVSGYFATLEGSLCIEIQPKDITPPDNDICTAAIELEVGATCEASNNTGAIFSGPLASCAVYQNASIWYWLEAPASGKAVVETNADFIHAVSAYAGTCTNLEEIHCVKNPNRCGQTFELGGLNPGEVYWIRVSSMRDLTGFWQTGALCVRLIDGDAYEPMPPLSILGYTECFGNGAAKLVVNVAGGMGFHSLEGNFNGEILQAGESYFVLATDEQGCQTSITGVVDCAVECAARAETVVFGGNTCPNDNIGSIQVEVTGGSGNYTYLWQDGSDISNLEGIPSGYYTVTVTDTDNACTVVAGGLVDGPLPYTFEIVEVVNATLEEGGSIEIDFSGGTPPYDFQWTSNGAVISEEQNPTDLLPGTYDLSVTDATGCTFSYPGIVVDEATSISEPSDWIFSNLFPNPTSRRSYLEWETQAIQVYRINVLSASGALLTSVLVDEKVPNPYPIDLDGAPAGVYFVRCQTNRGVISKRLILAN